MYDYFILPFIDYIFMRRALVACIAISVTAAPLGVFLILRRMSMMGEALSHAVLPGLSFAFLFWGLWLPGMTIGGTITGLLVALLSHWVSQSTPLRNDASLASFYLIPLALGVLVLSLKGGQLHVMHLLFGSILAVDRDSLLFIAFVSCFTLIVLAFFYRGLIYECFDPIYAQSVGISSFWVQNIFLTLVVGNLIAACQAIGTLMALGLMVIPAASAGLVIHSLLERIFLAGLFCIISCIAGLLLSYHLDLPTGPTIILVCGFIFINCIFWSLKRKNSKQFSGY